MKFSSENAFLFKVQDVYKKDSFGNDTKELLFKRLTFRDCSISNNALASISYFDVIPDVSLESYADTWADMVGKSFSISGTIVRTYNKETQKGYTNFRLTYIKAI